METNRHEYKNGTVKLSNNVKTGLSTVSGDIMNEVEVDDQAHMALVINYCATSISRKQHDVEICIFPTRNKEDGTMMLYTMYVGLPIQTVLEDEHFCYIRSISYGRITRNIKVEVDTEVTPPILRLEIIINSMRNMGEVDNMSVVNIHIKRSRRINLLYDNNQDDDNDKRGSTKRTRNK